MRDRRATFYYYSGTGNSRRVAVWLAQAADDAAYQVILSPIRSAHLPGDIGRGEESLFGLVFPTHAFTAPWVVLRFAVRLPRRERTSAVVVATRGALKIGPLYTPGFEGTATLIVGLLLALKGYHVQGMKGIDMPSNWMALHPSLPPGAVAEIIQRAHATTARFSDAILSGKQRPPNVVASPLGLLMLPVSLAYVVIGRPFLTKLFFASTRCTSCGSCATHCPGRAVEMRGDEDRLRPYWTLRCQSCMRCMAYCPVQAIEASQLLAIGVYLLSRLLPMTAALVWVASRFPTFSFLRHVPEWVVVWTTGVVALAVFSPLLHRLLRERRLNRLFTHSTLTHLYPRYHEPLTTLEDLCRRRPWT
ncbi:MAG: EFR1 family ferrodoxin [Anaerolineae bacterium]